MGSGYPKTGMSEYVDFEGWVLEVPNLDQTDAKRDYRIRYDIDKYKEMMSTDTDFLDGYSGTGLFSKINDEMMPQIQIF